MNKVSLQEQQQWTHDKYTCFRNLDRLLSTESFRVAWILAEDHDIDRFEKIKEDCKSVKSWIKDILNTAQLSGDIFRLREIAKNLGIKYYAQKTKAELIAEIKEKGSYAKRNDIKRNY